MYQNKDMIYWSQRPDDLVPKVTSGKESFYNNYEKKIDTETRNETTWTYLTNQTASMSI